MKTAREPILALEKSIKDWLDEKHAEPTEQNLRALFKEKLGKDPYRLRFHLDHDSPDLIMIVPSRSSDRTLQLVEESNGIVLDSSWNVVAHGMDVLREGNHMRQGGIDAKYDIEEAEDGTVIRVFNHDGRWNLATNRCLDAWKARWSSVKTFGDLFIEALKGVDADTAFSELDPGFTYSFVLLHPENQLVVHHPIPRLVSVGRRNNTTQEEEKADKFTVSWAAEPVRVSLSDLLSRLNNEDAAAQGKRGFIISDWTDPVHVKRWKLDYAPFATVHQLRKNLPAIHLSYLASSLEDRETMRRAFPHWTNTFMFIDKLLFSFAAFCYGTYVDAFIRRRFTIAQDDPIYQVLRRVHRQYKVSGQKITESQVRSVIDHLPVKELDSLLRYHSQCCPVV